MSEFLKDSIIKAGAKAMVVIDEYFDGEEEDLERVDRAFKMLSNSTRILHMEQVRKNSEKEHALKLLRFLPDESIKREYIRMTNPNIGSLLEVKPIVKKIGKPKPSPSEQSKAKADGTQETAQEDSKVNGTETELSAA